MAIQRMANLPLLRSFPPSSEAAPADYPVRRLTIQCSLWGFHVILQSFYPRLFYYGFKNFTVSFFTISFFSIQPMS